MGSDPTEALRKLRLSYLTLTQEAITNREERDERQRKADEGKDAYTDLLLKDSTDLYDEEGGVELTDEAAAERVAAVTALQGKTRQKQAKDKVETMRKENNASTVIQSSIRRKTSTKIVAEKREQHGAAVKVQSKVRQNLARQTVEHQLLLRAVEVRAPHLGARPALSNPVEARGLLVQVEARDGAKAQDSFGWRQHSPRGVVRAVDPTT